MDISITGLMGEIIRNTDPGSDIVPMELLKLVANVHNHYASEKAIIWCAQIYFWIMLVGVPITSILSECVWRIGAGVNADEIETYINPKEIGNMFQWLYSFRKWVQIFYIYDILAITLCFAYFELPGVAEYIQANLFPATCHELPNDMFCFGLGTKMYPEFAWLVVHVVAFYISAGLPSLYRITYFVRLLWSEVFNCCYWELGEDEEFDEADKQYLKGQFDGYSVYDTDVEGNQIVQTPHHEEAYREGVFTVVATPSGHFTKRDGWGGRSPSAARSYTGGLGVLDMSLSRKANTKNPFIRTPTAKRQERWDEALSTQDWSHLGLDEVIPVNSGAE